MLVFYYYYFFNQIVSFFCAFYGKKLVSLSILFQSVVINSTGYRFVWIMLFIRLYV